MSERSGARRVKRFIVIRPVVRLNNEINVTPLVDVVLVLLIIFMVVTPMLERDIAVHAATEERQVPDEKRRDQIVVHVKRSELLVNAEAVQREQYEGHLKRLLAERTAQDRVVFFLAEDDASYATLVNALDGAKAAGANVLGLTPDFMRAGSTSTAR